MFDVIIIFYIWYTGWCFNFGKMNFIGFGLLSLTASYTDHWQQMLTPGFMIGLSQTKKKDVWLSKWVADSPHMILTYYIYIYIHTVYIYIYIYIDIMYWIHIGIMYIQDIVVSMLQLDVGLFKAMAFNRGTCQQKPGWTADGIGSRWEQMGFQTISAWRGMNMISMNIDLYPICSMVLEYLPTFAQTKSPSFVGNKYTSTMEHMGNDLYIFIYQGRMYHSRHRKSWNCLKENSPVSDDCSLVHSHREGELDRVRSGLRSLSEYHGPPVVSWFIHIYIYICISKNKQLGQVMMLCALS